MPTIPRPARYSLCFANWPGEPPTHPPPKKKTIEERIHPSHEILKTPNTIVGERFATTWECNKCGAEAFRTNGGDHVEPEFEEPCSSGDQKVYLMFMIEKYKGLVEHLQAQLVKVIEEESKLSR